MRNNEDISKSPKLAADRRSRIYEYALRNGSVSVSELAEALGVVENTIRRDLDALHEEGKLVRSHGGASVKERGVPVPHYSQTRDTHREEKSWIGRAALKHLPASGLVFTNSGSTTYQLAIRMSENRKVQVATTSLEIAAYLAPRSGADVYILGGRINPDSLSSTCTMADLALDKFYYDVAFIGAEAIDIARGVTSSYMDAVYESRIIEHSRKTVVLCDSSKLGRVSNVEVAPLSAVDVLITDRGLNPEVAAAIRELGVEVELAGPMGDSDD